MKGKKKKKRVTPRLQITNIPNTHTIRSQEKKGRKGVLSGAGTGRGRNDEKDSVTKLKK